MSDEATPHYSMLIDQMTFGLKILFGECGIPKIAWQIDPFGHSTEVALQFADMGYDAVFFGRIDHEDYRQRVDTKTMEHIWRPDTSLGEVGELFTGILFNLYTAPNGFCFDTYCSDEPIMDNPKLHGYNVNERITDFMREVRFWAEAYKTNHVQITMGGDFNYIVASSWFKNMDKLIKYINSKFNDVNVLYSTPACYLKALHAENVTWPVKDNDDFFPYGSDEHTYWTGYFTSRPNLKNLVYRANNVLQAVKQLRVVLDTELEEEETLMNRAMGIAQHHDAVSGTEKQHVSDDYALYLSEGLDASEKIFSAAYKKWLGNDLPVQKFCRMANISQCEKVEGAYRFTVSVYNPLAHPVTHPVRVPVIPGSYKVIGPTGEEIPNELVPIPQEVREIPGRNTNASLELFFYAEDVPALGLMSYHVERFEGGVVPVAERQNLSLPGHNANLTAPLETSQETPEDIEVDNGVLKLIFNISTGQLQFIIRDQETWAFHQNFFHYEGSKGYNFNTYNRASGAYIFRPVKDEVDVVAPYANVSIFRGKHVIEVHQQFGPWVSQIIRLYQGKDHLEFQWLVGPIPVEKWVGKEVITRYKTQLMTGGVLYTDSNGRRLMRRVRNHRTSWNLTLTEPVASNYYPVTSAAVILGNRHQVTVLTDRPQGAASLTDGEIEIMLHRRLLYDDGKGVSEPLDEMQYNKGLVARGTHIVQLSKTYKEAKPRTRAPPANNHSQPHHHRSSPCDTTGPPPTNTARGAERHRIGAVNLVYGPLLTVSRTSLTASEWSKRYRMKYTGMLREPLPLNVHLLTLETMDQQLSAGPLGASV
ncbi:LOW QUALITY PROTEIN: lysosomal alpha-mannosidase-like [Homalodisca vitripennis]|uniref:LOW QUALITY PROTEIN: lysosomal alpha-mannosidase-like n=1 Tax=Homalodisca vitripennis TaxID=197043 RepID=UPI001EEAD8C4|nr:LOW QUALITY PROTEIN: lysosomal alpha-mannosidase-like [Homalodisca vitripennis]